MIILQLSDLHATEPGEKVWGSIDSLAAVERAVEQALTLPTPPDLVLLTGDLINNARPAQYAALRPLLDRLPWPKRLIAGNHDDRAGLRAHFGDWPGLDGAPTDPVQSIIDLPGLRLVLIDTSLPGRQEGAIDAATCDFLESALASTDLSVVIVQHHPPVALGLRYMDAMKAEADPRYFALVEHHARRIEAILCGHYHRHVISRIGGVPLIVAPSLISSLMLDLRPDGPTGSIAEPAGCLVHRFADGRLASHLWPIGDFGTPDIFA